MNITDHKRVQVNQSISLLEAVTIMNASSMQILLVVDERETLLGVVTDGDIRRALVDNIDFNNSIDSIMVRAPITMTDQADRKKALSLMKEHDVRHIPLVDSEGRSSGLLLWKDFFENGDIVIKENPNTVVIMAGGKGARLDLFTKILPKPLIPIGEKPIIEHIIDNFRKCGFTKFLISLNYKADMIKMYFSDNGHNYEIDYIEEDNFLGTAGSLSLARDRLKDTFIVSNCDVIIDTNLDHLFNYHKENKNHATILSSVRNVKIPYGVLRASNANLQEIIEKPEYNFLINSGIYVLEPEIIDMISGNQAIDMPDLLLAAKEKGLKIQVYPMTCSWFDVGEWGEYKKAIEHMTALGAEN